MQAQAPFKISQRVADPDVGTQRSTLEVRIGFQQSLKAVMDLKTNPPASHVKGIRNALPSAVEHVVVLSSITLHMTQRLQGQTPTLP